MKVIISNSYWCILAYIEELDEEGDENEDVNEDEDEDVRFAVLHVSLVQASRSKGHLPNIYKAIEQIQ